MPDIYAAMESAVWVDAAVTGEQLADHDPECVAVSPENPERVFVGTFDAGLWRSEDAGERWSRVGKQAIESDAVTAVAVDPHDPDLVWAGTEPSRVYRSTDGGDSWEPRLGLTDLPSAEEWSFPPRPHTHHVRWIEPDATESGRLYVGIEAGALVRTDDGGETWQDRPEGARRDNHTLATHPDAPSRVYSAAGDGYAESTDGGDTWVYPQKGLEHRYVWGLAVDPGDPERRLVSAASGAYSAHRPDNADARIYRRTGERWEEMTDLPTGHGVVRAVFATPGPARVVAATNRGLHRSPDFGRSWDPVTLDFDWSERYGDETPRGLAVV